MDASQSFIGFPTVTDGIVIMRLKPWDQRERAQQSIASELQPHLAALSGVKAYPVNPPSLGQRSTSKPIDFVIMSQVSYPEMDRSEEHTSELQSLMRHSYAVFCLKKT